MSPLALGIVYETFDTYGRKRGDPEDWAAEYEPEATIEALETATRGLGHTPVRLGGPHALLDRIARDGLAALDAALTIAEGYGSSRNREAWAPVLLEMAGVPALGSDALTLSLTLDKAWANAAVAAVGISVSPQCLLGCAEEARSAELPAPFPLFVKPRWEGTAKGIRRSSRVEDVEALAREVERIRVDYRQPALVEAFLPGAEYTVTVLGNDPPRALPVLQRALDPESRIGLHALGADDALGDDGVGEGAWCVPGELTPALEASLQARALDAYRALECRDFARADFRLDAAGEPVFLEINPLPTFAPDGTFGILAELEGVPLTDLLGDVLRGGLRRLGIDESESRGSGTQNSETDGER